MIDSHAHIYLEHFQEDIDSVIDRAVKSGVEKILLPNIDKDSIDSMLLLEKKYPEVCFPMIGIHPCSIKEDFGEQLKLVEKWLEEQNFLAIGEIGTDLYWDKTYWNQQKEAFNIQCELALKYHLPIVVHCRGTIDETIELVSNFDNQKLRGVFHCFTGSLQQAKRITGLGFYLGLGGVVTFKNSGMDQVIPYMDTSKIILETDAPYLTPAPHRGKRNEPFNIKLVAEKVAEYLKISLEELDYLTTKNTNELFFPKSPSRIEP